MSQVQTQADMTPQASAPKAEPKPKPTVALAAITPAMATEAAEALGRAASKREKADTTFLTSVQAACVGLPPMNAAQYTKQLAPSVRAVLKRKLKGKAETTVAGYQSRFKTLVLAMTCGDEALKPIAGEAYVAYLTRAAEGVAKGKLPDGSAIWPSDVAKPGRAAGTKQTKQAPPTGGQTSTGLSKGETDHTEGGMNTRPKLAAALILCDGNQARAQRLERAVTAFGAELDKWLAAILSDDEKARIGKQVKAAAAKAAA